MVMYMEMEIVENVSKEKLTRANIVTLSISGM